MKEEYVRNLQNILNQYFPGNEVNLGRSDVYLADDEYSIQKEENQTVISLRVVDHEKEEIKIWLEGRFLFVSLEPKTKKSALAPTWGTTKFLVGSHNIYVASAVLKNGILKIVLEEEEDANGKFYYDVT